MPMESRPHRPNRRAYATRLLRAAILAGIAFYVARLAVSGRLSLYIAPRMSIYVKFAALGLYAIAAVLVYLVLRDWNRSSPKREAFCETCETEPKAPLSRLVWMYTLFVVPLSLFFLTPDTTIGSAMASQKGMNLSTPASQKERSRSMPSASSASADGRGAGADAASRTGESGATPSASAPASDSGASGSAQPDAAPSSSPDADASAGAAPSAPAPKTSPADKLDALFPYDNFSEVYAKYGKSIYAQPLITVTEKSYMEILTTLDLYAKAFAGHQVRISGFVYRDPAITDDKFVIGRFAIQCCAADALPYGVLVDAPDAKLYGDNEWLTITGTLDTTKYGDEDVLLLKADQIAKIKPAKDPYVYGDPDFGT